MTMAGSNDQSVVRELVIQNQTGLHARPAAAFVRTANTFSSEIIVTKGEDSVNGKSIMGLMTLAAGQGTTLVVEAQATMPRKRPMPFRRSWKANSTRSKMEMDLSRAVKLARIELTPEEEQRLAPQLGEVLQYVEKLNELDVSDVEPTAHATPLSNVMREDEPRESLSQEEALRNAPKTANGLFVVPKIVE